MKTIFKRASMKCLVRLNKYRKRLQRKREVQTENLLQSKNKSMTSLEIKSWELPRSFGCWEICWLDKNFDFFNMSEGNKFKVLYWIRFDVKC